MKVPMKKVYAFFALLITNFFLMTGNVYAAPASICPVGEFKPLCNLQLTENTPIFGNILTILLILAIMLALFFLVWGAIRWIMSGGDKGKVESARNTILASIVGLVLAFLAFFILGVITFVFTGKTVMNFTFPRIVP